MLFSDTDELIYWTSLTECKTFLAPIKIILEISGLQTATWAAMCSDNIFWEKEQMCSKD